MDQGRGLVAVLVTAIAIAVVALLVGVGLIAVGLVRDDEPSRAGAPASSQPGTATSSAVRGVAFEPIAPARAEGDRTIVLQVRSDGDLACDLGAGGLGLGGGLRLAEPGFDLEIRRWRVETDEGLVSADFSGIGPTVRRGFALEPEGRVRRREDDRLTLVVLLSLREGSAATLDGALRPRAVVDGDPIGTLTITGLVVEP
jgi:hypothetical protein